MTRWFTPAEKLPEHNEQILVRKEDYIDLALFNLETKCFILRSGVEYSIRDQITWMGVLRNEE